MKLHLLPCTVAPLKLTLRRVHKKFGLTDYHISQFSFPHSVVVFIVLCVYTHILIQAESSLGKHLSFSRLKEKTCGVWNHLRAARNKTCSGRDWWLDFCALDIPQLPRQPSVWHIGDKDSISVSFFRVTDWQGQSLTTSLYTDLERGHDWEKKTFKLCCLSPYPAIRIRIKLRTRVEMTTE